MLTVLSTTHIDISETIVFLSVLEAITEILGQNTTLISIIGILITVIDLVVIYMG